MGRSGETAVGLSEFELQGFKEYANFSVVLDYLNSFPGASFSDQRFRRISAGEDGKNPGPLFFGRLAFGRCLPDPEQPGAEPGRPAGARSLGVIRAAGTGHLRIIERTNGPY